LTVMVDGGLLVEALDKSSTRHAEARDIVLEVMEGIYGPAYITDHAVSEALTEVLRRAGREAAVRAGRLLLEVRPFTILHVSDDVLEEAWRIFREASFDIVFGKALLVACAKAYNIEYIATLDENLARLYPVIAPGRKPKRGRGIGFEW